MLLMAPLLLAAAVDTTTAHGVAQWPLRWSDDCTVPGADRVQLGILRWHGGRSEGCSSLTWDSLVGRALLEVIRLVISPLHGFVARVRLLDSAAYSRMSGLNRLNDEELKLEMPPIAAARLNVTRLIVDGLESVKAFELVPGRQSSDLINATSSFETLRLRVLLDAVLHGFGRGSPRRTSVQCVLEVRNCSFGVMLRAAIPHKSIVQSVFSRKGIDPTSLSLSAEAARVRFGGGFEAKFELEDAGGMWGPPPLMWRWLSRALSRTLTPLVEEHVEQMLVHEVQASLQKLVAMSRRQSSHESAIHGTSHEQHGQCDEARTGTHGQPAVGARRKATRVDESFEEDRCDE